MAVHERSDHFLRRKQGPHVFFAFLRLKTRPSCTILENVCSQIPAAGSMAGMRCAVRFLQESSRLKFDAIDISKLLYKHVSDSGTSWPDMLKAHPVDTKTFKVNGVLLKLDDGLKKAKEV